MDNQEIDFALNFMLEHPLEAVKVLEQSEVDKVAEFFGQIPEKYIAPVMSRMRPEYAGRLAVNLPASKSAALMEDMDINGVANVLRVIEPEKREGILIELPQKKRHSIELLLTFSPRTIGAWMSPRCLNLPPDTLISEALHYLKSEAGRIPGSEFLYMVDRDGNLQGRAPVILILKSGHGLTLASVMETRCPTLPAPMLLEQAMEHKAWASGDCLPVVSRQHQFLGVITHSAMRRGLSKLHGATPAGVDPRDPVSSIFEVYGKSLLALFSTVSEAVDTDTKS